MTNPGASRFATWHSFETRADRWASYAALVVGAGGLLALVLLA